VDVEAPFTLAHFSDTHLGYEAYGEMSLSGNNQRGEDVIRAFAAVVDDIVAADPPLVVHSGDVADHPRVSNRVMVYLMSQFARLASIRPDGSRRQLVVIGGNHELPRNRKEACFLELYRGLPGVHVVTTEYKRVTFDEADGASPELADVVVHALPHDTLKDLASGATASFDDVTPYQGKVNVLVAHGVAGGSQLYVRSLGREFAIPTEVLARDWDYGALGHWHKRGPVGLVRNDVRSKVWYAGSSENMGFSDLFDNDTTRGWLSVTVNPGDLPEVVARDVPIRPMFRLPVFDATDLDPAAITAGLQQAVQSAHAAGRLDGAVVGQVVTGVSREAWSLVDLSLVRQAASVALHFEVTPRYTSARRDDQELSSPLGDLASVLESTADVVVSERLRDDALAMARTLLADTLADVAPATDSPTTDSPAPDPDDVATEDPATDDVAADDPATDDVPAAAPDTDVSGHDSDPADLPTVDDSGPSADDGGGLSS
jgi:DNA repair exonuclease SbcCD nuclease subunit